MNKTPAAAALLSLVQNLYDDVRPPDSDDVAKFHRLVFAIERQAERHPVNAVGRFVTPAEQRAKPWKTVAQDAWGPGEDYDDRG